MILIINSGIPIYSPNGLPLKSHVILTVGTPVTLHLILTSWPTLAICSLGVFSNTVGARIQFREPFYSRIPLQNVESLVTKLFQIKSSFGIVNCRQASPCSNVHAIDIK